MALDLVEHWMERNLSWLKERNLDAFLFLPGSHDAGTHRNIWKTEFGHTVGKYPWTAEMRCSPLRYTSSLVPYRPSIELGGLPELVVLRSFQRHIGQLARRHGSANSRSHGQRQWLSERLDGTTLLRAVRDTLPLWYVSMAASASPIQASSPISKLQSFLTIPSMSTIRAWEQILAAAPKNRAVCTMWSTRTLMMGCLGRAASHSTTKTSISEWTSTWFIGGTRCLLKEPIVLHIGTSSKSLRRVSVSMTGLEKLGWDDPLPNQRKHLIIRYRSTIQPCCAGSRPCEM